MALATLLAATGTSYAQTQNMVIVKADGTRTTINVAKIDSVVIRQAAEQAGVNLKLDAVKPLYAQFTTSPADVTSYNVMFMDTEDYDAAYQSDADVVADDLAYIQQMADAYGYELSALLQQVLFTEDVTEYVTGITPGSSVTLWGYGMDYTGAQTSPFEKVTFTTPTVEKTAGSIAITAATSGTPPTVTFTPDDASRYYMIGYVESTKTDAEIEDMMNAYVSENLIDYLEDGGGISAYLSENAGKGTFSQDITNLSNAETYDAVAAYLNEDGAVCSAVTRVSLSSATTTSSATVKSMAAPASVGKMPLLKPATPRIVRVKRILK